MATTLTVGQAAITAVNTEDNGNPQRDLINVLLLAPLDAGAVIYLTDRAWNGTAFAAAGGGDGTFAYTVPAGGLPAGGVISISQAQLTSAGINLSDAGETIYLYQGTSANTPTTFLHAVDIADENTASNGSLANTGLTYGTSAVAIGPDNAEFATRTWDIQRGDLFGQINTASHWAQNVNSPQDGTTVGAPTATAPDAQIWVAGSGAGEAIVTINVDGTYNSGNVGYQIAQAFQNDPNLYHPSDITLDTVHDRYFFVDSDAAGHNRIIQGSISQVLNNPGGPLTTTVLYSNANSDANGVIRSLSVDTAHGIIYFDAGTDANGSTFNKIGYNTANQAPTVLATLGADHYITQVAIDYTRGEVFLATSQIQAVFGQDVISQNYIYRASGLATNSTTLNFTELPFAQQDDNFGGEGSPLPGEAFPVERGNIRGIDIDPVTHTLYIATGSASLDNDGDGFTSYYGGVYRYALDGNPTGNISTVFVQNGSTGPAGLLYYLEVDAATGKYYVVDESGTNADPGDGGVWVGSLSANNTLPTLLATVGNINGLGPQGLEIQHASVLTGSSLVATFTEAAGAGTNGVAIAAAGSFQATDADSGGDPNADELAGAQVRISAGFQSGSGHQDVLTINGNTSGSVTQGNGDSISFSYNAATGVLTLSGVSTLDNYEAMLGLVRFAVQGDNPTNYGTAGTRTISYATFDGLLYSDEVSAGLTVSATNDAPVNAIPGGVTIGEDASPGKVFSTATANALSVSDADADPASQPLQVTLSVGHGTLTLASLAGLSFSAGDGTGDATMTFTGTANAINAALGAGLTYTGTLDYYGADSLSIVTSDQGNTGTGGATSDTDGVSITINGVADIANDNLTINEDAAAANVLVQTNDSFENSDHAITAFGQGAHGTVSINTNGTVGTGDDYLVYTADADYFGGDSFTYTVTSGGATETATVNVTVNAVNDAPAAAAAGADPTYLENGAAVTPFIGFTANPGPNESGQLFTQLKLTVTNVESGHDVLTIGGNTLTLTNGNSAIAGGITATVSLAGTTATVTFASAGTNAATLQTLINNMGYRYDGDDPSSADRVITITSLTDNGGTANGGVDTVALAITSTVHVVPFNDAPDIAVPGGVSISEDGSVVFSTANANALSVSDADADPATQDLSVTLSVAHGALSLASTAGLTFSTGDGTGDATLTFTGTADAINAALGAGLTYAPAADYNGADAVSVSVSDQGNSGTGGTLTGSASVSIGITAVADIADDTVTVGEDSGANMLDLLGNDSFEDATRAITAVGAAQHGVVAIDDNGTVGDTSDDFVTYAADADYNGTDSFTYTVTSGGVIETATVNVTVSAVADIADDTPTTGEDTAVNVLVLANDTFESTDYAITATGTAAHGTVTVNDAGTAGDTSDDFVTYTADADYNGTDSFTYTVTSGGVTETATVNVTVNAIADIADNSVTLTEDRGPLRLNLLGNDSFENPLRAITAVGAAAHGTVTINDNGTAGNTRDDYVVYTADADYNGTDSFTYTVTSGGVTETATVNLTVKPVVDIAADRVTTSEDVAINIRVQANDAFENADHAISAFGQGAHGTVTLNDNGTAGDTTDDYLVYTADADYNGTDSFSYSITSGGATETATVSVVIGKVADIADDNVTVREDRVNGRLNLLANDSFEDPTRAITAVGAAAHGTVTLNDNGTANDKTDDYVTYTAAPDYVGSDHFTYTVTAGGRTETATVNVTVAPAVKDIIDDHVRVAEDAVRTRLDLLANDTFEDPARGIFAVGPAAHGTVTIDHNGTRGDRSDDYVVYTADPDYTGDDTFTYTVRTTGGTLETATVTVTVVPVADIVNDTLAIYEDTGANRLDLLANDTFKDPAHAITAVGPAAHGIVAINDNGTAGDTSDDYVTYTADADYNGLDSFTYTVTSGGVTETGTVRVQVRPVNDAPSGADGAATIDEDTSYTFASNDFGFTDVDGNDPRSVVMTTLPADGNLVFDDGVDPARVIRAGGAVTFADIQSGYLTFVPNADANGTMTFTFQVRDDGGVANGGQNTDATPNTFTFTVTPVDESAVLRHVEDPHRDVSPTTGGDQAFAVVAAAAFAGQGGASGGHAVEDHLLTFAHGAPLHLAEVML